MLSFIKFNDKKIDSKLFPYGLSQAYTYDPTYKNNVIETITYSKKTNKYMWSKNIYTEDGKNVKKTYDKFNQGNTYEFDNMDRVTKITDPKYVATRLTYENIFLKTIGINEVENNINYTDGQISSAIAPNKSQYLYSYDELGRICTVSMNGVVLEFFSYDDLNNKVTKY